MSNRRITPFAFARDLLTRWDVAAILVVIGIIAVLGEASRGLLEPLAHLEAAPLSLDPIHLPEYAARTTLRMFAALALSLLFTFTYATWAAKSPAAGRFLVPVLDILQSVPVLGFISVTVVFFMSLTPGRVPGAELAAIFAIFTSQAWNMAFSFYQSLRTVPAELTEATAVFRLSPWMRFWQLEVPFALPALLWNTMMSMSGGWFFVVASESLSVGNTNVSLPGIGSYIATAIAQRDLAAIGWAIGTMLVVILAYDQLLFRPLVTWADGLRFEQEQTGQRARSWALEVARRSKLAAAGARVCDAGLRWAMWATPLAAGSSSPPPAQSRRSKILWQVALTVLVVVSAGFAARTLVAETSAHEAWEVAVLGLLTMLRVFVLIALASLVWVPVGVWVGLRPRAMELVQPIAQFLAAFPANLLFPLVVYAVVTWSLNPDIWLSPLMILGTQWYILFNVIAGASALPGELRQSAANFHVGGWLWWRRVALPAVFPYFVTGAITASGGSWNAAIVAEVASWGSTRVEAHGIGAYIAKATAAGDFHGIVLGIATMSAFVLAINRFLWRPLYFYAERRFRLE